MFAFFRISTEAASFKNKIKKFLRPFLTKIYYRTSLKLRKDFLGPSLAITL
jgi:hypothetical protein